MKDRKRDIQIDRQRNKGFTLVELIVVLVILAILAAILVPALLGYIDRAKQQQYIIEAKNLMTATQAGIAEAYATEEVSFGEAVRPSKCPKVTENYGYYTNYSLYLSKSDPSKKPMAEGKKDGAEAKNIISKRVVQYADSVDYPFASGLENEQEVSALGGKVGFVILFNARGKIVYMQYSRDGYLVTYDGSSFEVESGSNLKFVSYRNPK